jgi:hypothetical protein
MAGRDVMTDDEWGHYMEKEGSIRPTCGAPEIAQTSE